MFWVSLVLHRTVLNSGIPYLFSSFSQSWQTQMSCCPTWVLQTCPTTVTMTCSLCLRATEPAHSSVAHRRPTHSLSDPSHSRLVEGSFGKQNRYPIESWHCFPPETGMQWLMGRCNEDLFFCFTFSPVTMLLFVCFSEHCRDFIVNFSLKEFSLFSRIICRKTPHLPSDSCGVNDIVWSGSLFVCFNCSSCFKSKLDEEFTSVLI